MAGPNNKIKRKQVDAGEFTAYITEVAIQILDDSVSLVTTGDLQNASGVINTRLIQTGRDLDRMIRDFSGTFNVSGTQLDQRLDFLEGISGRYLKEWTGVVPTYSGAPGNSGEFDWDSNYFYGCVSNNNWRRVAWATF